MPSLGWRLRSTRRVRLGGHTVIDCCGWAVAVDNTILEASLARCDWRPFRSDGAPSLALRRRTLEAGTGSLLRGSPARIGRILVEADAVWADIPDEMYAAEAALRVVYQVAAVRQKGLVFHASAVAFGDRAVVAVGQSGAGKTTFARLCVSGGGARLLTDEMTIVLPTREVFGTPFRSNGTQPATRQMAELHSLLLLRHAAQESFEPIRAESAVPALLGQAYLAFDSRELSDAQRFERVAHIAGLRPMHVFSFRNQIEAGRAAAEWVEQTRAP